MYCLWFFLVMNKLVLLVTATTSTTPTATTSTSTTSPPPSIGSVSLNTSGLLIVNEHSSVYVNCTADNCEPVCQFTWKKVGDGSFNCKSYDGVLKCESILRGSAGLYTCTATNTAGFELGNLTIFVNYGPDTESVALLPQTTSYGVSEGGKVDAVTCSADCNPNCTYKWNKDGQSNPISFSSTWGISNVNRADNGTYICTAFNSKTNIMADSKDISLDVYYGPDGVQFNPSTESYSIVENDRLSPVSCEAVQCHPSCSYSWAKDGDSVGSSQSFSIPNTNRTDAGSYTCTTRNILTSISKARSFNLIVEYFPVVEVIGNNATENDTNVQLTCTAKGVPSNYTFYSWIHYDQVHSGPIRTMPSTSISGGRAVLTLGKVSYQDTGIYACRVSNGIPDYRNPNELTATRSTAFFVRARPVIISNQTSYYVSKGGTVKMITFFYSYNLEPTSRWQFALPGQQPTDVLHGRFVTSGPVPATANMSFHGKIIEQTAYKTSLTISGVEEQDFDGTFQALLLNSIGSKAQSIDLFARGAPEAPFNITVYSVQTSSVQLLWQPGFHNGADQMFIVEYRTLGGNWTNGTYVLGGMKKGSGVFFNGTVENLKESTSYLFRIYAENKFARGSFSPDVNISTKAIPVVSKENVAAVVGGVVGGILFAVVVILLLIFSIRSGKCKTADGTRKMSFQMLFSAIPSIVRGRGAVTKPNEQTSTTEGCDPTYENQLISSDNSSYQTQATEGSGSNVQNQLLSEIVEASRNMEKKKKTELTYENVVDSKMKQKGKKEKNIYQNTHLPVSESHSAGEPVYATPVPQEGHDNLGYKSDESPSPCSSKVPQYANDVVRRTGTTKKYEKLVFWKKDKQGGHAAHSNDQPDGIYMNTTDQRVIDRESHSYEFLNMEKIPPKTPPKPPTKPDNGGHATYENVKMGGEKKRRKKQVHK